MLRSTAREEEKLDYFHCGYFLTPPLLRATSPIFCITKHPVGLRGTAGEEVKSVQGREKGKNTYKVSKE